MVGLPSPVEVQGWGSSLNLGRPSTLYFSNEEIT